MDWKRNREREKLLKAYKRARNLIKVSSPRLANAFLSFSFSFREGGGFKLEFIRTNTVSRERVTAKTIDARDRSCEKCKTNKRRREKGGNSILATFSFIDAGNFDEQGFRFSPSIISFACVKERKGREIYKWSMHD